MGRDVTACLSFITLIYDVFLFKRMLFFVLVNVGIIVLERKGLIQTAYTFPDIPYE